MSTRETFDFTAYHASGGEPELVESSALESAWCAVRREKLASGEWRLDLDLELRYEGFAEGYHAAEGHLTKGDSHAS